MPQKWEWKQSVTYTTYVTHGDRAIVFMVTQDGKCFTAAAAEGDVDEEDVFTEDTHTLIGNRFKSMVTAQRACMRYERTWRKADGRPHQRLDELAFAEARAHIQRIAGVIAQA